MKTLISALVLGSMLAAGATASAELRAIRKTASFSKKIVKTSHKSSGKKGYYDPEMYKELEWGLGRPLRPWQRPIPGREY